MVNAARVSVVLALASLSCCPRRSGGVSTTSPHPGASRARARASTTTVADDLARRKLYEGRQLLFDGDFAGAKAAFATASGNPRTRGLALVGRAEAEFQTGGVAAAESFAAKAVAEAGGVRARIVLGDILFKRRDYEGATRNYEAALALDGTTREARMNLVFTRRMVRKPGR